MEHITITRLLRGAPPVAPWIWVSGYQVPRPKKQWTKPSVCNSNLFFLVVSQPICVYCVYVNIYIYILVVSKLLAGKKTMRIFSDPYHQKLSHGSWYNDIHPNQKAGMSWNLRSISVSTLVNISKSQKQTVYFLKMFEPWMTWSLAKPITWLQQALLSKVHTTKMARSQCGPGPSFKGL